MTTTRDGLGQLTRASEAQHSQIADLLESVFVGEGFVPEAARERVRRVRDFAAGGEMFVAEKDGAVVGTVLFVTPGSAFAEIARDGESEVRLLAVSPVARGAGIGRALMLKCISRSRETATTLVLSTQVTMHAAQRLYLEIGFVRCPERDWTHANGSGRLVYVLAR